MNRRHTLKMLAGLALCPLCTRRGLAAESAHWSYEGAAGPNRWGDLDTTNKVCALGTQQSPLDIVHSIKAQLPPLRFGWSKTADIIVNNGHTIQINAENGGTLQIGHRTCTLLQFHFHHPSEHRIAGKSFPMEAHFVYRDATGALAVVGVLMSAGHRNATFGKIVAAMPVHEGPPVKIDPFIEPAALLPSHHDYFQYEGSLTTPPCSETVTWLLLHDPIHVAQADLDAFARLYPMNARPLQNDNRRFVLSS